MSKPRALEDNQDPTRRTVNRATNVVWHDLYLDKKTRARLKNQHPCLLWFTGLSGAGKSTIANIVEKKLNAEGKHTYLLDGDNVRHGLNRDLGFSSEDRIENIRRVGEVGKLFVDAGIITLASFISPFRSDRMIVRELFEPNEFLASVLERLDPKYRIPLVLVHMEGLATREAARALDAPLNTVLSWLHRGRKRFEHQLWEYASDKGLLRRERPRG